MTTSSTPAVSALDVPVRRPLVDGIRRLLRNRLATIGIIIVLAAFLGALLAPILTPYSPVRGDQINGVLKTPSLAHPFGTDDLGRDVLSRVLYGAQISLRISFGAEAAALTLGTIIGLIAGYLGGLLDSLLMRVVDILMAFPLLIVAIALATALGRSEINLILALALSMWPIIARLARSQVLSIKETDYVLAARSIGANRRRIMVRHILPNILTPLVVYGTLGVANVILQEAALSFLGLGVGDQSTPSWGRMLDAARDLILPAPWLAFFPGLAIFLVVMGLNLLGDGLRDALDVRAR